MNKLKSIKELLIELKSQLDEDNARAHSKGLLDREDKFVLKEECSFNAPASLSEIQPLEKELAVTFPADYRAFLLLHNGMTLFSRYLVEYNFFSLDEIRENYLLAQEYDDEDEGPSKNYPIGEYPDVGYIMMNNEKVTEDSSEGATYYHII